MSEPGPSECQFNMMRYETNEWVRVGVSWAGRRMTMRKLVTALDGWMGWMVGESAVRLSSLSHLLFSSSPLFWSFFFFPFEVLDTKCRSLLIIDFWMLPTMNYFPTP